MLKPETLEAVRTIGILDELAAKSAKGFIPFTACGGVSIDTFENCIVYVDDPEDTYRVVGDVVLGWNLHAGKPTIFALYSDELDGTIRVKNPGTKDAAVIVTFRGYKDTVTIKDGKWHVT